MNILQRLREIEDHKILILGNHGGIIQSILDFDYILGKKTPSVVGIVGIKQKNQRYFWGSNEILIPGYLSVGDIDINTSSNVTMFAVAQSGRRVLQACKDVINLKNCIGGMVFAESVPERHAIELRKISLNADKFIIGPSSVGMLIGGNFKLGAIGGTMPEQIIKSRISEPGSVAVISSSGGMINEIIYSIARLGGMVSFAIAVGGERFPIMKPVELIKLGIEDINTEQIIYFGELGGTDEYDIAEYYRSLKIKKPIIAYIAGKVAETIKDAPQFGHAKSLANNKSETASAKKKVLKDAGVIVADSLSDFENSIKNSIKKYSDRNEKNSLNNIFESRKRRLFIDGVSSDSSGEIKILNEPLTDFVGNKSLSAIALSMFLGSRPRSNKLIDCFDLSLRLLVDHGPQVSGVVNTMITARAGKDLTASLATGILTIGPRFGGALNEAAGLWFEMVNNDISPRIFVSSMAKKGVNIPGIGHKKYRADNPDPRIKMISASIKAEGKYTKFAKEVERITTSKKSNLILNVDGYIAALMLDIFCDYEDCSPDDIKKIIESEFFNAIFVYGRTVGLISHYLEQRRVDDGLFRLPPELIADYVINK